MSELYAETDWRSDLEAAGVSDLGEVLAERGAVYDCTGPANPAWDDCAYGVTDDECDGWDIEYGSYASYYSTR